MTELQNHDMLAAVGPLVERYGITGVVGALLEVCDTMTAELHGEPAHDCQRVSNVLHTCLQKLMRLGAECSADVVPFGWDHI